MLCRCNYGELLEENSLCLWRRKLPGSIRDAMDLCSALFIRYIWVDSLCIIKDSPRDKNLHINNMHRIYQGAVLTIVSAAGKDANAGLPAFKYDSLVLNLVWRQGGCTCTNSRTPGFHCLILSLNGLPEDGLSKRRLCQLECRFSQKTLSFVAVLLQINSMTRRRTSYSIALVWIENFPRRHWRSTKQIMKPNNRLI
jgi:hypothetical protein